MASGDSITLKFHVASLAKGQEENDSDRVLLGVPQETIKKFEVLARQN